MKNLLLLLSGLALPFILQSQFEVVDVSPTPNGLDAEPNTEIAVTFSSSIDVESINSESFQVFGRWSGPMTGEFGFLLEDEPTAYFIPDSPFFAGEWVTVHLTKQVSSSGGVPMIHAHTFGFWIRSLPGTLDVIEVEQIEMREAGETFIQCYGAYAGDINDDESSDLVVVNEFSEDVRVLLNDGDGNYGDWILYDLPGSDKPSTNEGADFNHDGFIDIALGSTQGPQVSVLMGDGMGGFEDEVVYMSEEGVRGLAILDFDGDGWADIATANRNDSSIGLLRNLQDGTFADAMFTSANSSKETAAVAADMNEDGIMDLVIGTYIGSEIVVMLGDGNGNFQISDTVAADSNPWMIGAGDVNGDGHTDIASANAGSATVSIHLGNGQGELGNTSYYPTGDFPLAIDLGDLDGDGDLDFVSSDYSGVDFWLYENDGAGNFSNPRVFDAVGAGSCAIFHDRDGDGVMDMTGIDEIADLVIIYDNAPPTEVESNDGISIGRLYPNPAEKTLFFENPALYATVTLFDALGRELWSNDFANGTHEIDLDKNMSGSLVIARIQSLDSVRTERIVIK